jgi:flagellar export protein FliJ
MAIQRTLTRLLRLRRMEEEQSRLVLEAAVAERNRAEEELTVAAQHQAQGRRNFVTGILAQSQPGRTGGLMEMEQARRAQLRLLPTLTAAEAEVVQQSAELMARRTGRRQVETLVENGRRQADADVARKAQQMLDDWYGRRTIREKQGMQKSGSGPIQVADQNAAKT